MPQPHIIVEWLDDQIKRAAYCSDAIIPGDDFRALMKMAMPVKGYHVSGLNKMKASLPEAS